MNQHRKLKQTTQGQGLREGNKNDYNSITIQLHKEIEFLHYGTPTTTSSQGSKPLALHIFMNF